MALYRIRKGEATKLKPREIKSTIMKANNWTAEEYKKKYDIFKNKLRAYESYRSAHGYKVDQQSVVELLYKQAKSKLKYGEDYKPSKQMERIQSFSALSITKGRKAAQSEAYNKRRAPLYNEQTYQAFEDFIDKNPKAKAIWNDPNITDPVKREKALIDYANLVKAKIDAEGKAHQNETIQYGEVSGSDVEVDFDMSEYYEG